MNFRRERPVGACSNLQPFLPLQGVPGPGYEQFWRFMRFQCFAGGASTASLSRVRFSLLR